MKKWNNMTYEEAHRLLWSTIADMTEEVQDDNYLLLKLEAFKKINKNHEPLPTNRCFACEVVYQKGVYCLSCPIFDLNKKDNRCLNGLYDLWMDARGKEKAKYARKIAKLPWIEKEQQDISDKE